MFVVNLFNNLKIKNHEKTYFIIITRSFSIFFSK
jgi:hypothetical protein